MKQLSLGYSPCPNDTFIFGALANHLIDTGDMEFDIRLEDVETLNRLCADKRLHVTKISMAALAHYLDNYGLLPSGGALGSGCGPLIVARPGQNLDRISKAEIAVPGTLTTAHFLLSIFLGNCPRVLTMPFDQVMPALKAGNCNYGVIIHEGRFTYQNYGLVCLADLGEWWEEKTALPIPLGGIAVRRDLGVDIAQKVNELIRESLSYARRHPSAIYRYVRSYAQEMEEKVIAEHIRLYVNDFSFELGKQGEKAIQVLFQMGVEAGLLPPSKENVLLFQETR